MVFGVWEGGWCGVGVVYCSRCGGLGWAYLRIMAVYSAGTWEDKYYNSLILGCLPLDEALE